MANIFDTGAPGTTPDNQNDDVQKELQTRFALLPEELQKVITSSDYQMKLFDLAKKYKMTYEKLGTLELETTLVLLGMTHPRDFPIEMKNILKLPEADFNNLMTEIQVQVFDPIKKALQTVYPEDTDESEESQQPVPTKVDTTQKTVMEKAGITIGGRETMTATPEDMSATKYTQSDLLKSIENPPKSTVTELNKFTSAIATPPQPSNVSSPKVNESMQDSINNLLNNKTASTAPLATPKKIDTISPLGTPATTQAAIPDMPPMAPSDATNMATPTQTSSNRPTIDTISVAKKTTTDYTLKPNGTPTPPNTTGGDPYREAI